MISGGHAAASQFDVQCRYASGVTLTSLTLPSPIP